MEYAEPLIGLVLIGFVLIVLILIGFVMICLVLIGQDILGYEYMFGRSK